MHSLVHLSSAQLILVPPPQLVGSGRIFIEKDTLDRRDKGNNIDFVREVEVSSTQVTKADKSARNMMKLYYTNGCQVNTAFEIKKPRLMTSADMWMFM